MQNVCKNQNMQNMFIFRYAEYEKGKYAKYVEYAKYSKIICTKYATNMQINMLNM